MFYLQVCEHVMSKYGSQKVGLWLLQMKVPDPENYGKSEVEDDCYVTIKDSKHVLEHGKSYYVVHFTGSDIFVFT